MENEKYVLLVEDNPDDVTLTQVAFRKARVTNRLDVVCDGVEATEFLFGTGRYAGRDLNNKPAVILLDLKLPLLNGVQVLKAIRENVNTREIPVIVLTSSMEASDQRACHHYGVTEYLQKPGSLSKFVEIVYNIKSVFLS
jgi:two-component system, response regulator